MFFVVATILCLCLNGICTEDWLVKNVILCSMAEVTLFVWMIVHIRKGTSEILKQTRSLQAVKSLYQRILIPTGFCIAFGGIQLFVSEFTFLPTMIYGFNILGMGFFFFVWMCIGIIRINKLMRF